MVAEKPSVAKMLAEHLSGGRLRTRRGQSRANQIFEFIKYFGPSQQKCKLMVTSVVGHIYGLNFEVEHNFVICQLIYHGFAGWPSERFVPAVQLQGAEGCGGHD